MLRPPTPDDIDALHRLIDRIHRADGRHYAVSLDEVAEFWDDPDNDPGDDVRVADSPDGRELVAWGRVMHSPAGERHERAGLDGGVDPEHRRRGVGSSVMAWLDARATERLAATPDHLAAMILVDRFESETDRVPLLRRFGYDDARYFDELQRPLTDLPPLPRLDGIEIVPWASEHDEATCHVYNAAFADHWGSTPRSVESWCDGVLRESGHRLDVSFVAIDRTVDAHGGVVGYSLNGHYPDDATVTGRLDGWVESLGTLRSHRRRGIAAALIVHSLHAFARAGFESSMLGVDTENPSGAYGLYERLGFRPLHRGITAMKTVRKATLCA